MFRHSGDPGKWKLLMIIMLFKRMHASDRIAILDLLHAHLSTILLQ